MKRIVACMFAFMALSLSTGGFAGERPGAFSLSPFIGGYNYDDHINMYTRPVGGLRIGYNFTENWVTEAVFNYGSTELDNMPIAPSKTDVSCYNYRFDLLYNVMPGTIWVPFLAAGVGGATRVYAETEADTKNTDLTVNAGGGLKCFLSESFDLRGDVRHVFAFNGQNGTERMLHDWEYTVGVSFLFGGGNNNVAKAPEAAPAPVAAVVPEAPLQPIPVTEPTPERTIYFVYLNIEFDIARADIRPQYRDEMAKVGDFMKKYPATKAVIEGYTDSVGTDEYNMELSQQRADSVVKSLEVNFGINSSRLSAKAYGKTMPVATNTTGAGRQANRHINAIIDGAFDVAGIVTPPNRLSMSLNVEFNTNSAEILPAYYDKINKVGEFMKQYPTTTAVIEGHTDNAGTDEQLMQLSQQRAESVVAYLVEKYGIDRSRLTAKGYGDTRRIAYNSSAAGRQRNRRINAVIDFPVAMQ